MSVNINKEMIILDIKYQLTKIILSTRNEINPYILRILNNTGVKI